MQWEPPLTQGDEKMDYEFYDVKAKAKVKTAVTDFATYGKGSSTRYAFKGKTKDGRNLTTFVSKETFEKAQGGKCCKKGCKK